MQHHPINADQLSRQRAAQSPPPACSLVILAMMAVLAVVAGIAALLAALFPALAA